MIRSKKQKICICISDKVVYIVYRHIVVWICFILKCIRKCMSSHNIEKITFTQLPGACFIPQLISLVFIFHFLKKNFRQMYSFFRSCYKTLTQKARENYIKINNSEILSVILIVRIGKNTFQIKCL